MKKNVFKSMSTLQKLLAITTLSIAIFWTIPLFILFIVGFLPTFTAFITNKKNKNLLITICCFNIAGIIPFIFKIIGNFSVDHALSIVTNILYLIVIFGFPGVGMLIFNEIPSIATSIVKTKTKNKLKEIDKNLEKLREEWGDKTVLEKITSKR